MATLLLFNPHTFKEFARFVDGNTNFENKIVPTVREMQLMDLKPVIGDEFLSRVLAYVQLPEADQTDDALNTLLKGGSYEGDGCGASGTRTFDGLYAAGAYFVWSRLVLSQNAYLGVNGLRQGTDSTSSLADYKIVKEVKSDTRAIAERMMAECLDYIKTRARELGYEPQSIKRKRKQSLKII